MERLHYVKAECTSCIRAFGEFPTLLKLPSSEEGGEKKGQKRPKLPFWLWKGFTQFTSHIKKNPQKLSEVSQEPEAL